MPHKLKLLFLCWLAIAGSAVAQSKLAKSLQRSPYTYIYRLSADEVKRFYQKGAGVVDESFFHTLYDSYAAYTVYPEQIPHGHYLFAYASGPDLAYELKSINPYSVKLLPNQQDLVVLLHDSLGQVLTGAQVKVGGKKVPYDATTQTYRLPKYKKNGLLEVRYGGFVGYEYVTNTSKGPFSFRRLPYTRPFYYLWKPVQDVVHSIKYEQSGWVRSVVSVFDDYYRNYDNEKYTGYVATNKPKYQPGDTIRYKAFILMKNGRPYRRNAWLQLYTKGKYRQLQPLTPYRPGAFSGELVLHDSLNLTLDEQHTLYFMEPKKYGDVLLSQRFRYEDYELNDTEYTIRLAHTTHYLGQENKLHLRGTNANELNLLDARVEVLILSGEVQQVERPQVFVQDTLWVHQQELEPSGETTVALPTHIFPEATMTYRVVASFLNSSNERVTKQVQGQYRHRQGRLSLELLQDSARLGYLEGDTLLPQPNAILSAYAVDGKRFEDVSLDLPAQVPLNPYVRRYELKWKDQVERLELQHRYDLLAVQANRNTDSLFVAFQNPRRLPYWYFVYRQNKLVASGQAQDRAQLISLPATGDAPYFVSVHYVWAGEMLDQEDTAPYLQRRLHLDLEAPQVVYPGQQVGMVVSVADATGKPVPDVDLTAYATSSKFKESVDTNLPSFDRYKGRKKLSRLKLTEFQTESTTPLDWQRWNKQMGLDSLVFYDFLYPETGLFQEYALSHDSLTQFAPFVVDSGRVQPVHVIFVDEVPVYFSGTDEVPNYAFPADSGYHTVKLRTAQQLITLEKVYFRPHHKLTLSIDPTKVWGSATPRPQLMQGRERTNLNRYLFSINRNFNKDIAYLKQGSQVQVLPHYSWENRRGQWYGGQNQGRILAGPFQPDTVQFNRLGNFTTSFIPEPDYQLTFEPGLLKMRESVVLPEKVWLLNKPLATSEISLFDESQTEKALQQQYEALLQQYYLSRIYTKNDFQHPDGEHGLIRWSLDTALRERPEQLMLYRPAESMDSARFYSGLTQQLNKLPAGEYELLLLLESGSYVRRLVEVKPKGQTILHLSIQEVRAPDKYSQLAEQELQQRLQRERLSHPNPLPEQATVTAPAERVYRQGNFSHTVYGRVTDKEGYALPGAVVSVKGTQVGTNTDANGGYTLSVPADGILVVRFIGFIPLELPIRGNSRMDVELEEDVQQLQEVMAFGIATSNTVKYTAPLLDPDVSSKLYGSVAGVEITGTNLKIRGISSVEGTEPLLIVDGLPFSGKQSDINPDDILSINVLRGEEAMALYGSAGAVGVVVITTRKGNEPLLQQGDGIRGSFSDYAFWQPRLITDAQGKAAFDVVFPGDMTSWNTHVLAMDDKKRSGVLRRTIRSFKAVMGTLDLPRFLVAGDKAQVIGKALNYLPDSTQLHTRFEVEGKQVREQQISLNRSITDSLTITAPASGRDSVEVLFAIQQPNGFEDGERRHVKVYPKGVAETTGQFFKLHGDTTLHLEFDPAKGSVQLQVQGGLLQVMLDEIDHLHQYEYWCSEQAASKLKALLLEKSIRELLGEEFRHERDIKKLIKHLEKTQLERGQWSWWERGQPYLWISQHVSEALVQAKAAGYTVAFKEQALVDDLVYQLEKANGPDKVRALETLNTLQAKVDYSKYVAELEKQPGVSLEEQFRITRLRQQLHLPVQLDTLQKYKRHTTTGSLFWGEPKYTLFDNSISHTLLAYQILSRAGAYEKELKQIQTWLLNERRSGHWRNTYESARVLETLLPDLFKDSPKPDKTRLAFAGALQASINSFPYDTTYVPTSPLEVKKSGTQPLYFTAHQTNWMQEPGQVPKDFVVKTYFKGMGENAVLVAGKPVELIVELTVKADADFVMLEVPVPAGCSYADKGRLGKGEVHREYFRHKTVIFNDSLKKGIYTYSIMLQPRFRGKYSLNPAKASLMYFPTFFGREKQKQVEIR